MFHRAKRSISQIIASFLSTEKKNAEIFIENKPLFEKRKSFSWAALMIIGVPAIMSLVKYINTVLNEAKKEAGTETPEEDTRKFFENLKIPQKLKKEIPVDKEKREEKRETKRGAKPKVREPDILPEIKDKDIPVPSKSVKAILNEVVKETGIDKNLLYTIAAIESSFKTGVRAKGTEALGLFQFTQSTWDDFRKRKAFSHLKYTSRDIRNPKKNATLAAYYFLDRQQSMKAVTGREPSVAEIYLGHFLGTTGAAKFLNILKAEPDTIGAEAFEGASRSNREVFYEGGKALTIKMIWDRINNKTGTYYRKFSQDDNPNIIKGATRRETAPPVTAVPVGKINIGEKEATKQIVSAKPVDQKVTVDLSSAAKSPRSGYKKRQVITQYQEQEPEIIDLSVKTKPPITYMRDRGGRLIAVQN